MTPAERRMIDLVRIRNAVTDRIASSRILKNWRTPPRRGPWTDGERLTYVVTTIEQSAAAWAELERTTADVGERPTILDDLRRTWMTATFRVPNAASIPRSLWPERAESPEDLDRRVREAVVLLARLAQSAVVGGRAPTRARHRDLGPLTFDEWTRFLLIHTLHHTRRVGQ